MTHIYIIFIYIYIYMCMYCTKIYFLSLSPQHWRTATQPLTTRKKKYALFYVHVYIYMHM